MGSIDFGSEPAYWYERTMRDSERAQLPTRSRPAINRDERLIAREVRRHLDRVIVGRATLDEPAPAANERICGACGQRFSRRDANARRLWRVIYPRGGEPVRLYRHLVCPVAGRN